jgi:hypothetical protein
MASTIKNKEGLQKIRLLVGSTTNEWKTTRVRCSRCASFVNLSRKTFIPMGWTDKVEDFRQCWVYLDAWHVCRRYEVPQAPARSSSLWGMELLEGTGFKPLEKHLKKLREEGLIGVMIAKEFLHMCIAPLQEHQRRIWEFTSEGDTMMLHPLYLGDDMVRAALKALFATDDVPDLHLAVTPLYRLLERDAILKEMPSFDQWGQRPPGFVGERSNPLAPTPDPDLLTTWWSLLRW